MFIHYKCKTKNVEWIKVKDEGKISWLPGCLETVYIFVVDCSNISPYPLHF